MNIVDLFKKPVDRSINGVVKADQLDDYSVWQELEEFVVTRELDKHIRDFFSAYVAAMDKQGTPEAAGAIGIWVSGFFGSGKSHLIKVLSYLLQNRNIQHEGEERPAVSFFQEKIKDALLFAEIKKAVSVDTDVILFNIDSKADKRAGREAVLTVFLKVFNEMLGYSGDHPHIAHMERFLDREGKLQEFHANFHAETGEQWLEERDIYEFRRDGVVSALAKTLGQSIESATRWIDSADKNFALNVENFCKWVKEYLDSKGPNHRLVFFVDEVGQFIGDDTGLMLNLQTITELLGTQCGGRAWVVVTSQEDIDAVLGEVKAAKANDFSKIQGRFKTRLSLSSANTDEVIQARLLEKNESGKAELESVFAEKGDIIKNQLTFSNVGMTFRKLKDGDDFSRNYPFSPYQFQLVQKIFESIRKAGATGLHLSRGERSMLDAFQSAAKQVIGAPVGVLIPLYRFYPSIESFLDTAIKRTIDQAATNTSLDAFDVEILRTLFLIRYVDEMKGNVDNLVTLCIDEVDADRLALRQGIEASLLKLEKETLISRSGEVYFFLTNEERDISREIKNVELNGGEEARLIGELIYKEILGDRNKHRYIANKKDFAFTRFCDMHPVGNRLDKSLLISVVTPLSDDYSMYDDAKCILKSNEEEGHILVRLPNDKVLGRELRAYLQTEKYISRKNDGTQSESVRRILNDRKDENRDRRARLIQVLTEMLTGGSYYVAGQKLDIHSTNPQTAVGDAFNNLITNTFSKMGHLKHTHENPERELQSILRVNDIGQQSLEIKEEDGNPKAILEVRNYIDLCTRTSRKIVLHELIERFEGRPFGWAELEVLVIVARLIVLGEISLVKSGEVIPTEKVFENVIKLANRRSITVMQRRSAPTEAIQAARNIGKQVFSEMGPDGEDALFVHLRARLHGWESNLKQYQTLANTGHYPGQQEIEEGLEIIKRLISCKESIDFIERFIAMKDDLIEFVDSYRDVDHFYQHQRPLWESLRKAREGFQLNELELSSSLEAAAGLRRIKEILQAPAPYALIQEASGLIEKVGAVNQTLVAEHRKSAQTLVDAHIAQLEADFQAHNVDGALQGRCLKPLKELKDKIDTQESIAHIAQAKALSDTYLDHAIKFLEETQALELPPEPVDTGVPVAKEQSPKPGVKKSCTVVPARLVSKNYLETQEDVTEFVNTLRQELEDAIQRDERIRIR